MTRALIFDSGVGGLSVVGEIRRHLPGLALDYAADDAFRPYGSKTPEQLRARLPGLVRALADASAAELVVIACNTASVTALDAIRASSRVPVVGVVPAVKPAALATRTGRIAVLGTPATVRQDYVSELVADFASEHRVIRVGSVALVDMAEAKLAGESVDAARLARELTMLGAHPDLDTVVLACTHFPLLREELRAALPRGVKLIDSGEAIARRVRSLLPAIGSETRPDMRPDTRPDTAVLVGPDPSPARRAAFARFGFVRVVALEEPLKETVK